jgi:hypothetical protein
MATGLSCLKTSNSMPSLRATQPCRHSRLQLFKPVEDNLDLWGRWCSRLRLAGVDNPNQSCAIGSHVVVSGEARASLHA